MELTFIKVGSCLVPCDPPTIAHMDRMGNKAILACDFKKKNHYEFHQKLICLATSAYEHWEPGEIDTKYGKPVKNFDNFRSGLTIGAGYYTTVFNVDGSFKLVADSWSFGKMDDTKRQEFYQAILTVIMEKIYPMYEERVVKEMADNWWNELSSYA